MLIGGAIVCVCVFYAWRAESRCFLFFILRCGRCSRTFRTFLFFRERGGGGGRGRLKMRQTVASPCRHNPTYKEAPIQISARLFCHVLLLVCRIKRARRRQRHYGCSPLICRSSSIQVKRIPGSFVVSGTLHIKTTTWRHQQQKVFYNVNALHSFPPLLQFPRLRVTHYGRVTRARTSCTLFVSKYPVSDQDCARKKNGSSCHKRTDKRPRG